MKMTVWEMYAKLEGISKNVDEPMLVASIAQEFCISKDILSEYLIAFEMLDLIRFSGKEQIVLCN